MERNFKIKEKMKYSTRTCIEKLSFLVTARHLLFIIWLFGSQLIVFFFLSFLFIYLVGQVHSYVEIPRPEIKPTPQQ